MKNAPQNPIRVMVVDDEPVFRRHLKAMLENYDDVTVVAEASSVGEAGELFIRAHVDVVFSDVRLSRQLGFDLLPKLGLLPAVVWVSAYDQYAVKAFELGSIDFLPKPIFPDRLSLAMQRCRSRLSMARSTSIDQSGDDVIAVPVDRNFRMVNIEEISCIQADENYSTVYLTDGTTLYVYRTLGRWLDYLPENRFIRISRSIVLGLGCIKTIKKLERDSTLVGVEGLGAPIKLGRIPSLKLRNHLRRQQGLGKAALLGTA